MSRHMHCSLQVHSVKAAAVLSVSMTLVVSSKKNKKNYNGFEKQFKD